MSCLICVSNAESDDLTGFSLISDLSVVLKVSFRFCLLSSGLGLFDRCFSKDGVALIFKTFLL